MYDSDMISVCFDFMVVARHKSHDSYELAPRLRIAGPCQGWTCNSLRYVWLQQFGSPYQGCMPFGLQETLTAVHIGSL